MFTSPRGTLPENDAAVDFVLMGAGAIDGVVDGAQGRHRFVDVVATGEPARARWMGVNIAGEFRFENVPACEYLVSLSGGPDEPISTEKVVVVAGQRSKVTLVMKSSTVELTIRVPWGRESDLQIEHVDGTKRVSLSSMRMTGRISFSDVKPGRYRVSLDGNTWTDVEVVPADPPEQTVDLTRTS